jgi:hypothetical protein
MLLMRSAGASLQAEQKLWLQTDPSDMMNEIIFNVRKVPLKFLL